MKRWLSVFLAAVMMLTLCIPVAQATPDWKDAWYAVPQNPTWSEDGDMLWESDFFTTRPDAHYRGFVLTLECTVDLENPSWSVVYDSSTRYEVYTQCPNLGEFDLPRDGWYRFAVAAYGYSEEDRGDSIYACEYWSDYSAWSEPKYFEPGEPLAAPTNLSWDGTTMVWTMTDLTLVKGFWYSVYYLETLEDGTKQECEVTNGYKSVYGTNTVYRVTSEESGLDTDWLIDGGTNSYYFKVWAQSSSTLAAADSPTAVSSTTLDVNADAERLPAPTGLYWDGCTMKWPVTQGVTYDVDLYFLRELTEEEKAAIEAEGGSVESTTPWQIKTYTGITGQGDFPTLDNTVLENRPADYFFQVRAVSQDLTANLSSDWSEASETLYMEGRFALPTPTDLVWQEDGTASWAWEGTEDQQANLRAFHVNLYYHETEDSEGGNLNAYITSDTTSTGDWRTYADKDGWYSFDVWAYSKDYNIYEHGDRSARSGLFYYDAPDPLPAPTDLIWEGAVPTWSAPVGGTDQIERYQIELCYYGADGTAEELRVVRRSVEADQVSGGLENTDFDQCGNGVYRFKLSAFSADPTAAANSTYAVSPALDFVRATEALPAPTGLCWDGSAMKWDVPEDVSGIAWYEFRCYGDNNPIGYTGTVAPGDVATIPYHWSLALGDNLCFQVHAVAKDPMAWLDSQWVTCGTFYVPPEGLTAPTDLQWDGKAMTWSWVPAEGQSELFSRYLVELYYASTLEETPVLLLSRTSRERSLPFAAWVDAATREGYYFFTVTAVSTSQDLLPNSEPSDMSAGLYLEPAPSLPMPGNVRCDGPVISWTSDLTQEQAQYTEYEVQIFREGETYSVSRLYTGMHEIAIPGEIFAQNGAGTYIFTVRAVSQDPSQFSNSYSVRANGSFVYAPAEPPVEMTAQAENGTLTITVNLETPLPVQAFCGVYDQNGRLLETRLLDLNEVGWEGYVTADGSQTITLNCGEEAYTVKLFLLSSENVLPVYEPTEIPVK